MTWILSVLVMVGGTWHPLDLQGARTEYPSLEQCKLAASEVMIQMFPLLPVEGIAPSCRRSNPA